MDYEEERCNSRGERGEPKVKINACSTDTENTDESKVVPHSGGKPNVK
jgi:hypothetical protein